MNKLSKNDTTKLAEALDSVKAKSTRLYRISGFWCYRIVCEDGSVRLGTSYDAADAMASAFGSGPLTMEVV